MLKIVKKSKGITLVAIIIAIVIMLILVGVSSKIAIDSDLIGITENTVDKANDKVAQQQNRVDELMGELADIEYKQSLSNEISRLKGLILEKNTTGTGSIKEILGADSEYDDIFRIDYGQLVYKLTITDQLKKWLDNMGIKPSKIETQNLLCEQNPTIYYIADESNLEKYTGTNIGTLEQFGTLVNSKEFSYEEARLIENIYLDCDEDNQWTPIGTGTNSFTKIFDGQGYTISGIYINDSTLDNVGLFGKARSATIKNVGVIEGSITGNNNVGGIVGVLTSGNTIYRCFNEMNITGYGLVSGICGQLIEGTSKTISECYNKGTISLTDLKNSQCVSGICSNNNWNNGAIYNCYNRGDIIGGRTAGGIYGSWGVNDIYNCYNTGNITSTYCGGSIHGMNYKTNLRNCFGLTGTFSSVSSYNNSSYGATVTNCSMKSEAEMKSAAFVTILNTLTETVTDADTGEETIVSTTQDVWVQDKRGINDGYPILKWQK